MDRILKFLMSPRELERYKKRREQKNLIRKIAMTEKEKAIDVIKEVMGKTDDDEIRDFAAKHVDILEKKYFMTRYKEKAEQDKLEEDKELLRKGLKQRDEKLAEIAEQIKKVFPDAAKDEKLTRDIGEVMKGAPAAKKPGLPDMVLRFRATLLVIALVLVFLSISSIRESYVTVKGIGKVTPKYISNIQAEIEGKIEDIYVDEGFIVEKGQIIGRFEKQQFLTQLGLEQQVSGSKEIGKAEASLKHAEEQYDRYKTLFEKDSATKRQMEDTEFNLKYAKEEYEREQDNIKKCDIKAPISGVVLTSKMKQKVGSYLKKGEFICTIADLKSLNVEVPIKEKYINRIKVGQKASVNFHAHSFKWFSGKVVSREQIVFEGKTIGDIESYQFMVTVQLDKPIGELPLKLNTGMTALVKIWYQ